MLLHLTHSIIAWGAATCSIASVVPESMFTWPTHRAQLGGCAPARRLAGRRYLRRTCCSVCCCLQTSSPRICWSQSGRVALVADNLDLCPGHKQAHPVLNMDECPEQVHSCNVHLQQVTKLSTPSVERSEVAVPVGVAVDVQTQTSRHHSWQTPTCYVVTLSRFVSYPATSAHVSVVDSRA